MTAAADLTPASSRRRWVICGLLFAATAINYIDRQTIAVLKPTLQHEFGWNEITYGDIVFWFQAAYAIGYISFGSLIDRIGARFGYAFAVALWSGFHIAHAFVRTVPGFIAVRFGLGLGEAGSFPAGLKSVAEWFPKRERALAIGVFNAGSNIGAIITPLIVPIITLTWGWPAAFIATGALSIFWLVAWIAAYRTPEQAKGVSASELELIRSDPPDPVEKVPWLKLLPRRETWAYAIGKFLIDPIWWMYLFWLPDYFGRVYHLDLKSFGPPLVAVYVLSDIGSVAGGWMSSGLMKRGVSLNVARKSTMLICALLVIPIGFSMFAKDLWTAVGIIGLAAAAHQGFSANLYALPSDVFPRRAVGSVTGIGGSAGAIGGMLMAKYAGWVLEKIGTYTPIFIVAASAYLIALLAVHVLTPKMEPAKV